MLHDTKDLFHVKRTMYQFFFMIEDRGTIKGNKVDGMEDTIPDTEERRLTNDNKIKIDCVTDRTVSIHQASKTSSQILPPLVLSCFFGY